MFRNWFPRTSTVGRAQPRRPRLAPNLVCLEDRSTPATFYVDPTFPGAGTATFNAGAANEKAGVAIGTEGFASLAAAITAANAAAGADTILISDASHEIDPSAGTVLVTDELTISGRDKTAATILNIGSTVDASGPNGAILRADSTKLNLSSLTFDGNGTNGFLAGTGVWFDKSTGTVDDTVVTGVIDESDATINRGSGVVANGTGAVVVVQNSTFTNLGRNSVFFFSGATGAVRNNIIEGRAKSAITVGVNVTEDAQAVLITGNKFSGFDGGSTVFASLGVLVSDSPDADSKTDGDFQNEPSSAVIVGNSFSGNEFSISIGQDVTSDASTALVQYNSFLDPEVLADTTQTVDGKFNFYGNATGPQAGAGNVDGAFGGDSGNTKVPDNFSYLAPGANPNNGVLVVAPDVFAVPYVPGQTFEQLAGSVPGAFVTGSGFDNVSPVATPSAAVTFGPGGTVVTVTFDEAVNGFDATDLVLTNATAGTVTNPGGDNKTFEFTITSKASGDVTLALAAGAATDANGNGSAALAAAKVGTADLDAPTATFTAISGSLPITIGTTGGAVTLTFSEPVTGLTASDFTIVGPNPAGAKVVGISPASGTGTVFTVQLSATATGTITLSLPAAAAADTVGNPSVVVAGTLVANADLDGPTVTITSPDGDLPRPYAETLKYTFTFSEPVTGFTASDIVVSGTTGTGSVLSINPAGGNGTVFTVTVGGFGNKGDVTLAVPAGAVTDAVGNVSIAAGPILVATADVTAPTAIIDSPSATLPIPFGDPLTFRVTFSEVVTGFDPTDVVISGTATGTPVTTINPENVTTPDGKTFLVTLSGFTGAGDVSVALVAGAAADAVGNPSAAVAPVAVATGPVDPVDTTPPTVTIAVTGGQFVNPLTFVVTFSEAVTGFTSADIVLGGTATGGAVSNVVADASGKAYTVTVTGFTGRGTVTVQVPAGAAADAAGNGNTVSPLVSAGEFAPTFSRGFAAGGDAGLSQPFFNVDDAGKASNGIVPFEASFTGGVRVATADVNGDGTLDTIVGAGVGRVNEVVVYDGANPGTVLFRFNPFETSFTAGVFVHAADINGDGKAEVIVSPDEGGGPRVSIYDGASAAAGTRSVLADFFGIDDPNFRGGARVGSGDLDGDGTLDIFVSAGFGGGPRVAIFDGKDILAGVQTRLVGDFFGYEEGLRNGVYISGGDLDGDGKAEIILGAGPGGGPRVRVLSGADLLADNTQTQVANFFGGNDGNRGGIRVAAKDIDGDGIIDIVTGPGAGGGSKVSVYYGKDIAASGTPAVGDEFSLFGDFANGVYVG